MELSQLKPLIIDYGVKFILSCLILIIASYSISYIKESLKSLLTDVNVDPALSTLLSDIIKFILWILTFALIFNLLGVKEVSLALGGSIALIGMGLAKSVSNIVGDLASGIFLIMDDDFQVGYKINAHKIEGIIEAIDIRKTKIRDTNGNLQIIPNKMIDSSVIIIKSEDN